MKKKILAIDDEPLIRDFIKDIAISMGYDIDVCAYSKNAIEFLQAGKHYDLVLLDMRLPDMSGIDVMKYIKKFLPTVPVVIMTAYGEVENAVNSMKTGALDYLQKPFNVDKIEEMFKKILGESVSYEEEIFNGIVGKSDVMRKIFHVISVVAKSNSTVLIEGETGTGKELIANAIHSLSERKDKPFVRINCAAIPAGLLERELFGHEKGAFTGATEKYEGKFVQANNGTLLLDEIGDMDMGLQAKLLRTLQEKEIMPIGSSKTIKVNVRVIATTNADLETLVKKGRFRKDLYYRLNIVPIKIPPLRERKEDIPVLAKYFLNEFSGGTKVISSEAIELLKIHKWEGNVRELRNLMERLSLIV